MARRIPPLNPLRVFEVCARTGNLTQAAQELHVTQSAVSRQVATLEAYLGLALFRRDRHGVTLTRAGARYAEQLLPAFEQIAAATEQLLQPQLSGALRVRTYTTFAAKWLIPRLPEFQRAHPDIEVRISTAVPDVDFDRDEVDLAIQFGQGRWPRVQLDRLFGDLIEPVCSPAYLRQHAPDPRRPEALLAQRLLVSHYRRADWDDWLAATGRSAQTATAERMTFGSSVLTWQAALDGLGTAIGQVALLEAEFASGALVRPFGQAVERPMAYWLLRPLHQRESASLMRFRDWLLAAARPLQAGA